MITISALRFPPQPGDAELRELGRLMERGSVGGHGEYHAYRPTQRDHDAIVDLIRRAVGPMR
jgi:hypothetical protein